MGSARRASRGFVRLSGVAVALSLLLGCETTEKSTLTQTDEEGKTVICSGEKFTGTQTDPQQLQGIVNAVSGAVGAAIGGAAPGVAAPRAQTAPPDLAAICGDSSQCTVMHQSQCYGVIKR